jgi:hypothetical protein
MMNIRTDQTSHGVVAVAVAVTVASVVVVVGSLTKPNVGTTTLIGRGRLVRRSSRL